MKRIGLFGFWILCVLAAFLSLLVMLVEVVRGHEKALDIAVGFDQTANVALINGDVDETISSRAYRKAVEGRLPWMCIQSLLDWLQPNHCRDAFISEKTRAKAWLSENDDIKMS